MVKHLLLTGKRQVGKTTALSRALPAIRDAGLAVSGLVTRRVGPHDLEVHELHTGVSYMLTKPFDDTAPSPLAHFIMDPSAVTRSIAAIHSSFPTDVFVLDELGPLEFKHRQGWVDALSLLISSALCCDIVVVRPALLGQAVAELHATTCVLVRVTRANRDLVPRLIVDAVITACRRSGAEPIEGIP